MKTGWPPGLLQDDDRKLSRWFANRPDARYQLGMNMKDDDDTLCYRSELEAAVRAAVEAEREACAKVCDERAKLWPDEGGDAGTCAIYIRERGNT